MSTILLNLTGISYTYFTHPILRDLDWEIQAGQKIGLIGANGGGNYATQAYPGAACAGNRLDFPDQGFDDRVSAARRAGPTPRPL